MHHGHSIVGRFAVDALVRDQQVVRLRAKIALLRSSGTLR